MDLRRCLLWMSALMLLLAACGPGPDTDTPAAEDEEVADTPAAEDEEVAEAPAAQVEDATGDAADPSADAAFDNRFNLIAMAHSSPETVRGLTIEVETTPWDGASTGGPYSFASAPCHEDAPINNVSSNLPSFNTRLEGSRSPASTRLHPIEFDVLTLEDGRGELQGRIELTVCQPRFGVTPEPAEADVPPDEEKDRIFIRFTAVVDLPTPEEATYHGDFTISGGTGVYDGLEGGGEIAGYFMCLGPDTCEDLGEFRDAQVAMIGSYTAPEGAVDEQP
jgi:hypothetical protein